MNQLCSTCGPDSVLEFQVCPVLKGFAVVLYTFISFVCVCVRYRVVNPARARVQRSPPLLSITPGLVEPVTMPAATVTAPLVAMDTVAIVTRTTATSRKQVYILYHIQTHTLSLSLSLSLYLSIHILYVS